MTAARICQAGQLIGDEGLDVLATDGGHVGRHVGIGQEARQPAASRVSPLRKARRVVVGYDLNMRP